MAAKQEVSTLQGSVHLEPVQHNSETLTKWVKWINDPDIRQWMYNDLPRQSGEINHWLYNATHDSRRHYFSIKEDGRLIGFVSLRQDHAPDTTGEIGIVIGEKEYQNRGIGSHALAAITQYAQESVGLTSLRALIKPANEKSIRLFTRQGFVPTRNVTIDGETFLLFKKELTTQAHLPTGDILHTMQKERPGKLAQYTRPLSVHLERELTLMADDIPAEQKPSIESLIPKLKIIFRPQDKTSFYGQAALDILKTVGGFYGIGTLFHHIGQLRVPASGTGEKIGKIGNVVWDISLISLISSIPGPNTFKKYDVAAVRPELRSMVAEGTLNEQTIRKLFTAN